MLHSPTSLHSAAIYSYIIFYTYEYFNAGDVYFVFPPFNWPRVDFVVNIVTAVIKCYYLMIHISINTVSILLP